MGCPYLKEEGVGSYWCKCEHEYISYDTFNTYCYHSLDYHDCPAWKHKDETQGAQRTQGDNCYFTTACTVARGLPDDCHELETLRDFRDHYLLNQPYGVDDVAEYYQVAPKIVDAINKSDSATELWNALYVELVQSCVELIEAGDYESAYELYKHIFIRLKEAYVF